MTQKQIASIANRLGRVADCHDTDEYTRRLCVYVLENEINLAGGFDQFSGGYRTEKISLQKFRELARVDMPISKEQASHHAALMRRTEITHAETQEGE